MAKIKFNVEAGLLTRNGIRNMLDKLKSDIEWEESEATISITENKSFLESFFTFQAINIRDNLCLQVQNMYNRLRKEYN